MSNGIEEFPTQSATLLFVPAGRRRQTLPPCCFEISQCPGHCPRMSRAIRCFTLSHDSSFSVPASSASTRRLISLSQAMPASGSAGPSRLASNSAASSARAFASRRRASASTDSMAFVIVSILRLRGSPNKLLEPADKRRGRCPEAGCTPRTTGFARLELNSRNSGEAMNSALVPPSFLLLHVTLRRCRKSDGARRQRDLSSFRISSASMSRPAATSASD